MKHAALTLVASAAAAAGSVPAGYVPTPVGYMLQECVHNVPAGAHIEKLASGARFTVLGGAEVIIPPCTVSAERPMIWNMGSASASAVRGSGRKLQFPADYRGWIEYANVTAPNMAAGFDAFTGLFSTPSLPSSQPDVLYLFPGLQNIDWIPIVDPLPTGDFDIIQPVIQFPGDQGNYWSVKSWWVTLDVGAMASNEVQLLPGDNVFGNMTKTGTDAWFINSVNTRTSQATSIIASGIGSRLKSQPWAYVTLECYGCTSCSTYPAGQSSCAFSDMVLVAAGGKTVFPTWQANAKPSKNHFCNESIEIYNTSAVNIYFNGQP